MITEWLIDIGVAIAVWFVGLVPAEAVAVPQAVHDFDGMVNGFVSGFGNLGVWVPWPLVILCAGLSVGIWAALLLVKGTAWVWGQIPVIGGSG